MEEKKTKETKPRKKAVKKQVISGGTAVKGLINGFVSYGFLLGFIFLIVLLIILNIFNNVSNGEINLVTRCSLSLMSAIILYYLIRLVCDLSTFDLLKKCKIEKEDIPKVSSRMNLFYIIFVILSIVAIVLNVTVRLNHEKQNIEETRDSYYALYSDDFANALVIDMIEDFSTEKLNIVVTTSILEAGVFLGSLSLIKLQKKLIEKYNK